MIRTQHTYGYVVHYTFTLEKLYKGSFLFIYVLFNATFSGLRLQLTLERGVVDIRT